MSWLVSPWRLEKEHVRLNLRHRSCSHREKFVKGSCSLLPSLIGRPGPSVFLAMLTNQAGAGCPLALNAFDSINIGNKLDESSKQ